MVGLGSFFSTTKPREPISKDPSTSDIQGWEHVGRKSGDMEREGRGQERERVARKQDELKVATESATGATGATGATRELADAQHKISALQKSLAKKDEDVAHWRKLIEETQAGIGQTQHALTQAQREAKATSDQVADLQSHLQRSQRRVQDLEKELESQKKETRMAQKESRYEKAQHAQTRELLETRTSELKGAQAFLTTTDTCSGAEVIGMVEALNSEIHQAAAFIADSVELPREVTDGKTQAMQEAYNRLHPIVGRGIVDMMASEDQETAMQVACQAGMVTVSRNIITAWRFDPDDTAFRSLYTSMQESEVQSIFGKWRSLTRFYIQRGYRTDPEKLALYFAPHMADVIVDILISAGYGGSPLDVKNEVLAKFGERMKTILEMGIRLNAAIGNEIISSDLCPVIVAEGADFLEKLMVDAYGAGSKSKDLPQGVLCTTDMGLELRTKVTQGEGYQWHKTVLLKPKVALVTLMDSDDDTWADAKGGAEPKSQ